MFQVILIMRDGTESVVTTDNETRRDDLVANAMVDLATDNDVVAVGVREVA